MSLESLVKIVPPPATPLGRVADAADWRRVEASLGTALPDDYKAFVETYGAGKLGGFVRVRAPGEADWQEWVTAALSRGRASRGDIPFPIHPEPAGLLPFADTDNGDVLWWLREGDPASWAVIVTEARGPEQDRFDASMTEVLEGLVSRELVCSVFPEDCLDRTFVARRGA
jgi:hypothetical protein